MDTSYPHVGDGFDDFNGFDVELLAILKDTVEDPAWEQVGDAVNEFGSWVSNASFDRELEWEYDYGDEEDDGGDDSGDDDGDSGGEDSEEDSFQYVVFDDLHPMQTSMLNKHILDLGFELMMNGPWDSQTDYPNDFNMTVTDSTNDITNVVLTRDADGHNRYFGRFTAESLGKYIQFQSTLEAYRPACADQGCTVESSRLEINSLRPGLLEDMTTEVNDEIFLVSAIGVLVNQSETTLVNQPYFVESTTYDAALGALDGAEIDSAVLRISPGLAESAVSTLSPEGDLKISSQSPSTLRAVYSSNDVDDAFGNHRAASATEKEPIWPMIWGLSGRINSMEIIQLGRCWIINQVFFQTEVLPDCHQWNDKQRIGVSFKWATTQRSGIRRPVVQWKAITRLNWECLLSNITKQMIHLHDLI